MQASDENKQNISGKILSINKVSPTVNMMQEICYSKHNLTLS